MRRAMSWRACWRGREMVMKAEMKMRTFLLAFLLLTASSARADGDALILYPAYGDSRQAIVEGRVVEAHKARAARADDGWLSNLKRNARLMKNDERKHVRVLLSVAGQQLNAFTDGEGYFSMPLAGTLADGWHKVAGKVQGRKRETMSEGELLIVPPANTVGVITDLDDTILVSDVLRKKKLLKNTFLKNPLQREPVPGAAQYIRAIAARNPQPAAAPVIYLSASPRQIEGNIRAFLQQNDFPPGVLLAKRVSNDRHSDPLTDQIAYKTAKIEDILARLPHVRFVLLGDDGESDPETYRGIAERFPDRIEKVMIRHVNPDPRRPKYDGQLDLGPAFDAMSRDKK